MQVIIVLITNNYLPVANLYLCMERYKNCARIYLKGILWALAVLVAASSTYLFLLDRGYPVPYIEISTLHQIIIFGGEFFLLGYLYKIYSENRWKNASKWSFILIFLIVNCFLAQPFLTYYLDEARFDVPKIRMIRPYLMPSYLILLVLTGIFALLAHRDIKCFRTWLIKEIDQQRKMEDQNAIMRIAKFVERFPQLTGLPILARIFESLHREGWGYILAILALSVAGMILRVWNLDAPPLYIDELLHLVPAKEIYVGEPFDQITYSRSFYTVTLPLVISYRLFGINLWAARFAGILVNTIAVIPLYLISKRVNKLVGILAVGLYVFSPWMIATSRIVREYAYYPLYFYLITWVMIKLLETIPTDLIMVKDYRRLIILKFLVLFGILSFIQYFISWIDRLSTFKLITVSYPAFGFILLKKVNWRNVGNVVLVVFLLVAGWIILGKYFILLWRNYMMTGGKVINDYFLTLFYDHPAQQWYYNRPYISFFLLIIALLATSFLDKKKMVLPFFVLTYIVAHLSFALFTVKGNKPRYAISIEFWYILIIAVGLFGTYIIVQKLLNNKYKLLIGFGVLLLFWNVPHSFVPSLHATAGYAPISGEYLADLAPGHGYLYAHLSNDDVLITTSFFHWYLRWVDDLTDIKLIRYDYEQPDAELVIYDTIETYSNGWIALDYQRGYEWSQPIPLEDFIYAGKQVTFLGWYGDIYILRWEE